MIIPLVYCIYCLIYSGQASFSVSFTNSDEGLGIIIKRGKTHLVFKGVHHKEFLGETIVQTGTLGIGRNLTCATPEQNICFQVDQTENTLEITWETTDITTTFMDCFDLNTEDCSWFGGPERF